MGQPSIDLLKVDPSDVVVGQRYAVKEGKEYDLNVMVAVIFRDYQGEQAGFSIGVSECGDGEQFIKASQCFGIWGPFPELKLEGIDQ